MAKLMKVSLLFMLALFFTGSAPAADVSYEEMKIPMVEKSLFGERAVELSVKVYKPAGNGKFPLLLINHGRPRDKYDASTFTATYKQQSNFFVSLGFVVANPLRRGYGSSGGSLADSSGRCESPDYENAAEENIKDIRAVIDYMRNQPYIDSSRIVLVGQSVGGFSSIAYAGKYSHDIAGAINFAGGHGSKGPGEVCKPAFLIDTFGTFGRNSIVPTLWIYAEDDSYFAPELVKKMHAAYTAAGGKAKLIFLPRAGYDHHLFTKGMKLWEPYIIDYLKNRKVIDN